MSGWIGYCGKHGDDRRSVYRDAMPADEKTKETHRAVFKAIGKQNVKRNEA